jgi:hypothetical protein
MVELTEQLKDHLIISWKMRDEGKDIEADQYLRKHFLPTLERALYDPSNASEFLNSLAGFVREHKELHGM